MQIFEALSNGNLLQCLLILEGENFSNKNATSVTGETLLIAACRKELTDLACILIEKGAEVNTITKYGHSALYYASLRGNKECIEMLINAGADISDIVTESTHKIPIMDALAAGNMEKIQNLISRGADINNPNIFDRHMTPLHYFLEIFYDAEAAERLIKLGADIEAKTMPNLMSPIHFAAHNAVSLELILSSGANPNVRDNTGTTPLHIACYHGFLKCTRLLVKYEVDLNIQNNKGETALSECLKRATKKDKFLKPHLMKCIELLIESGAYISAEDQTQLDLLRGA